MADLKISQLSDGGNSQATDEYVIARSGANYRIDGASVAAAATSVGTLTSLTVSGDLTVDTSTLKVDSTNNRVGVGTASPSVPLHISSSSVEQLRLYRSGGGASTGGIAFYSNNASSAEVQYANILGDVTSSTAGSHSGALLFSTASAGTVATKMTLDTSGNLGLGVTPSAWGSGEAIQAGNGFGYGKRGVTTNAYFDAGATWRYIANGLASLYQPNAGQHVWYTAPSGTAGNAITFTQAMTLDASGRLLLGRTSGTYGLDLTSSDGNLFRFTRSSDELSAFISSNVAFFGTTSSTPLSFMINSAEKARITSGGYFKASNGGTYANSTGTFHELRGDVANDVMLYLDNTSATNPYGFTTRLTAASPDNNTQYFALFSDSTTNRCIIWSDGDLANHDGVYGTISDERLKQDIVDAGSQWDDLKAVRFRKYRMKTDVEANPDAPFMLGVVAQELEQTSPGLVDEHPDFEEQEVTDEDGNVTTERVQVGTTKTVKSSILLMKAAVALQEAMARIEALEVEVAALKAGA